MGISLRELGTRIEREIAIKEHDVEAIPFANQKNIVALNHLCLDTLVGKSATLMDIGRLSKMKKTQVVFKDTLLKVNRSIKEHGYWSFWHTAAIALVTCFAYEDMLKRGLNKTLDLSDESNLHPMGIEYAVLSLNFLGNRSYPAALTKLHQIMASDDVDINDVCRYLLRQIRCLTEAMGD
jgi:hypothetical protein